MDRVIEKISRIRIGLPDNIRGLKSSLKFLIREINLEKVESGRFNIELGL